MTIPRAMFDVGQLVHHRLFDYRGVVFDVDPEFDLTDEWYENVARSRPPKAAPWYHVLVDGTDQVTYVAEKNLQPDGSCMPIAHPLLGRVLGDFADGRYDSRHEAH